MDVCICPIFILYAATPILQFLSRINLPAASAKPPLVRRMEKFILAFVLRAQGMDMTAIFFFVVTLAGIHNGFGPYSSDPETGNCGCVETKRRVCGGYRRGRKDAPAVKRGPGSLFEKPFNPLMIKQTLDSGMNMICRPDKRFFGPDGRLHGVTLYQSLPCLHRRWGRSSPQADLQKRSRV